MLKKVMIKITSRCEEIGDAIFERFFNLEDSLEDGDFDDTDYALQEALEAVADVDFEVSDKEPDKEDDGLIEIFTEGRLRNASGRISISYDETEITGMAGARTTLSFNTSSPELVTMTRTGSVNTALVFEPKKRHICTYNTPYMPFEICVRTLSLDNRIESDGEISIEYIIEIRGATAERNSLLLKVFEV